ncbi:hypothetical protein Y032_0002g718 [Ancylostoma ceylanicum]|uniref:Uncharacterized protein n=1 Tax=Ancylostoma ceylanicum TaxID=53326 RepID=A0A016W141_9BILA|nr:hypothetical protein Y032_0002g718 [Ancylostoma ceylanicum]
MDYKVYFAFAVVSSSYGICPDVLRTDKNAALDFIMRASRMNFEDLVFIQFQKFWGLGDDAILEEAKEEKPLLYRKMVNFLERCNELSLGARKYMIEGFLMAMQHALFYHRENYYTTEQLSDAKWFVRKLKHLHFYDELVEAFPDIGGTLHFHDELVEAFPDIDCTPPFSS